MVLTVAKQKKRGGSGFVWGLMFGIAIGAAVTWVLTPQPGEVETPPTSRSGVTRAGAGMAAAEGEPPTLVDLAVAAAERVRGRFNEAVVLGREAYSQGQTEVMQRFNQARSAKE